EAAGFGTYDYKVPTGGEYWSPSLRRIAGLEGEKRLTLERVLDVVHPDDRDVVAQHVQGFSSAADRRTLAFRIVRPDGSGRWRLGRGAGVGGAMAACAGCWAGARRWRLGGRRAAAGASSAPRSTSPSASRPKSANAC